MIDGTIVPSVTQILSSAGLVDYSHVNPDVLEEGALRGTETHLWCELLDHGIEPEPTDPRVAARVAAYMKFRADVEWVPILIEKPVYNRVHRYAGTPDRVGRLRGRMAVIDFKPPGPFMPWWPIQLAGYAAAAAPGNMDVPGRPDRFVLQLRDDGDYRLRECRDRGDFNVFFAAAVLTHFLRQTRGAQ